MTRLTGMNNIVYRVIQKDQHAADDDTLLISYVWMHQGWDSTKGLVDNLRKVSAPETITRSRRKLHERGFIKYSKDTEKQRSEQYVAMRNENSSYNGIF